jgi:hypothetical protein
VRSGTQNEVFSRHNTNVYFPGLSATNVAAFSSTDLTSRKKYRRVSEWNVVHSKTCCPVGGGRVNSVFVFFRE